MRVRARPGWLRRTVHIDRHLAAGNRNAAVANINASASDPDAGTANTDADTTHCHSGTANADADSAHRNTATLDGNTSPANANADAQPDSGANGPCLHYGQVLCWTQ